MGSICLSAAPILRCTSLTRTQNVAFLLPTALEVIFSTSLIVLNRGAGRRHLLLTAEGWIYFALALLELLSHILPAVRENLSLFRGFDVGIGVVSFLPLFFYTFFLYLFTKGELIETLPNNVRSIAKLTLISFVPAVVISNEIASFVGVSIRGDSASQDPNSVIMVGFTSKRQEETWTFFTSLTLALLMVSQATVFCFACVRLMHALLHQRRIGRRGTDPVHLVKGTGWITGAMKLGAIETVIGFAGGSFGVVFTRRTMRLLARGCLCIGIVKGVDVIEDFQAVRHEIFTSKKNSFRRSEIRKYISKPLQSTFRQLSPTAVDFHSPPRAPHYVLKRDTIENPTSRLSEKGGLPGMDYFATLRDSDMRKRQRVTVLYNDGAAPTLHLRFSDLDLPSPAVLAESIKSRPQSEWEVVPYHNNNNSNKSRNGPPSSTLLPNSYFEHGLSDNSLVPPQPRFSSPFSEPSRDSLTSVPSSTGPPAEIIVGPRHVVKPARAHVYQTPATIDTNAPFTSSPINDSPIIHSPVRVLPTYPARARRGTGATDRKSRSNSQALTIRSGTDSILAMRELVPQFPGPPPPSWKEGSSRGVLEESSWMDTDPSSPHRIDNRLLVPGRGLGSPAGLAYQRSSPSHDQGQNGRQGDSNWGHQDDRGNQSISPSSILFASKTDADIISIEGNARRGSNAPHEVKPTSRTGTPLPQSAVPPGLPPSPRDPFRDDGSVCEDATTVVATPRRMASTGSGAGGGKGKAKAPPSSDPDRIPSMPNSIMPVTIFNGFSESSPGEANSNSPRSGTAEDFLDLHTGKSANFVPPPALPIKMLPVQKAEKLARVAQWVDSTSAATTTTTTAQQNLTVSLQNLHERGKSIDNLSIAWFKDPNVDKQRGGGGTQISRVKTVGKAPSRSTPPIQAGHVTRGSLHLDPIIIPPPAAEMPQIVRDTMNESPTVEEGGRNVLRDSEVLGMEDRQNRGGAWF